MKIFLLGFMGSGKSTLGRELAQRTGYRFIDLDRSIEINYGMNIPELFKLKGESEFRAIEREQLMNELKADNFVMALGGGTPCFFDNIDRINQEGVSIYLDYSSEFLAGRLGSFSGDRPLLKGKTGPELVQFIRSLLTERLPYYEKANIKVQGNGKSIQEMTEDILRQIGKK